MKRGKKELNFRPEGEPYEILPCAGGREPWGGRGGTYRLIRKKTVIAERRWERPLPPCKKRGIPHLCGGRGRFLEGKRSLLRSSEAREGLILEERRPGGGEEGGVRIFATELGKRGRRKRTYSFNYLGKEEVIGQ